MVGRLTQKFHFLLGSEKMVQGVLEGFLVSDFDVKLKTFNTHCLFYFLTLNHEDNTILKQS